MTPTEDSGGGAPTGPLLEQAWGLRPCPLSPRGAPPGFTAAQRTPHLSAVRSPSFSLFPFLPFFPFFFWKKMETSSNSGNTRRQTNCGSQLSVPGSGRGGGGHEGGRLWCVDVEQMEAMRSWTGGCVPVPGGAVGESPLWEPHELRPRWARAWRSPSPGPGAGQDGR